MTATEIQPTPKAAALAPSADGVSEADDLVMTPIVVRRDGDRDLRFTGARIAATWNSPDRASGMYSGSVGRWTEHRLYRTRKGAWVCQTREMTQWDHEDDVTVARVCQTEAEVIEFFGVDQLAKEIYAEAGIDVAIDIE